VNAQQLT